MKMNKTSRRILSALLILMIVFTVFPKTAVSASSKNETEVEQKVSPKLVRGKISADNISKYGNIYISVSCKDFLAAGYNYGDIVKVKILGKKYRLPFVSNYSDVDSGKPALLARESDNYIALAINMGDFATNYGIAEKTTLEDGTVKWNFAEGITGPIKVSIWLKKAGGYSDEYETHKLVYSNERSDYLNLIDEEFANFRAVNTSGMGFGVLYRTSSPINPKYNRNTYADEAIKKAGVNVVINLADSEEEVKNYEGFQDSYYSTTNYIALSMNNDFLSAEYQEKLAKAFRFMADNPGIYAILCNEGKDRAGYVTALLECLMGASYDEVVNDYMVSFNNYYGITKSDPAYEAVLRSNIAKSLKSTFTFTKKDKKKDLTVRNLSKCAEKYLKKIGLSAQEISRLKTNLSANVDVIEKNVPVIHEDGHISSFNVKIFADQPNIAYCGIKEYVDLMGSNKLSSRKDKSGNIVFTSESGAKAKADIKNGTLSTNDWAHFLNPSTPYEGFPKGLKDSDCDFVRISEIKYEGKSKPVTFDFNKYGLKMYSYDQDVYLSVSLVSSLFSDITTRHIVWNGEKIYIESFFTSASIREASWYSSPILVNMVKNNLRPEDVINESFAETCFIFDYLYGYPGKGLLEKAINEKGLEQAILDLGEEGEALLKGLKSSKTTEYCCSLYQLFMHYLDDGGHTVPSDLSYLIYNDMIDNYSSAESATINTLTYENSAVIRLSLIGTITEIRNTAWGEEYYREYGNTAIIRIDDFLDDSQGWKKYYEGEGDIPEDTVGRVVSGLRKASENPEIKNILFDLTANTGGSSDILGFVMNITTGRNYLNGYNTLTDQKFTVYYEADTNLDGVFDEKDKTVYDRFNYGVLTSHAAFSCGNLCPVVMREAGAVIIGETTGGGSCSVQIAVQPDLLRYFFSSGNWALRDSYGNSVEGGSKVDIPITPSETVTEQDGEEIVKPDYSMYYDDKELDKLLNDWFAEQEEKEAA